MKYFYNNAMNPKRYLTCKRKAKEWVNQDLPDVYRVADKTRAIEVTFPEYKVLIYATDEAEAQTLEKFVKASTGKEAEIYI